MLLVQQSEDLKEQAEDLVSGLPVPSSSGQTV